MENIQLNFRSLHQWILKSIIGYLVSPDQQIPLSVITGKQFERIDDICDFGGESGKSGYHETFSLNLQAMIDCPNSQKQLTIKIIYEFDEDEQSDFSTKYTFDVRSGR